MATSGSKSVVVTNWDTLKFSWTLESQSITDNTSTIYWKLELIAGSSGRIDSSTSKSWAVAWDDGTSNSGTNTINISNNSTKTLASGTKVITHNANGVKSFTAGFSQQFDITFSGSSIGSKSGSITGSLPNIDKKALVLSADNFNDEENPTITYKNPLETDVDSIQACLSWTGNPDIAYRDIPKVYNGSYTFNLTTAERNTIRNAMSSKKSMAIKFYIKTTLDGVNYYSSISKTVTIVNAEPTLSPTVTDVGSGSTVLTGDGNIIINRYNYVNVNSGASAKKGATIKSYKITCGNKSLTTASGSIANVESGTFTFTVTDSRGYTVTETVEKTFIPYVPITCNLELNLPSADGYMLFYVYGNYFGDFFGKESNNLSVKYRYKIEGDTSYSEWISVPMIIDDVTSTYRLPVEITGLDYQKAITIQAQSADKISTITSAEQTVKATPVFDWSKDDFRVNVLARFNGGYEAPQKILWGDHSNYMNASQTITLPEPISAQNNGILLVFSAYSEGSTVPQFNTHFVSKKEVELLSGNAWTFLMVTGSNFAAFGSKMLTITDTTITGHSWNTTTGTASSITYNNAMFVLRYVIGV